MDEQPSDKILRLAAGRWEAIYSHLASVELGAAMEKAPRHVACPIHGSSGSNDGFRMFRDWRENGGGVCNTCGAFHDGIGLMAWLKGMTYKDTLKLLLEELEGEGGGAIPPPAPRREADIERERKARAEEDRQSANRIRSVWQSSLPLDHPRAEPARLYFARRGLKPYLDPRVLRFHPGLHYLDGDKMLGTFPALVFRVSDGQGRSVTLHRIYLDCEGNKAPVPKVKKLMGYPRGARTLTGGAIRLAPAGRLLGIAEGPETALAIMEATGMPVWSAISTSLMRQVQLPDHVEKVVVWLDKDANEAGRIAGQTLCERMWAEGRYTGAVLPGLPLAHGQSSVDWLDVWNRLGYAGYPQCYVDPASDYRRRAM
ncbi:toprim domain-containing protein [Modicisalibacter sp. MOD 31.J]|uniref:DUF7146 domain-containing protein n=1 Tax=Modicisalibacter sp. MOD 31.J TaxID=2831897 RepID=UPI001CC92AE7|nr:toprim domain-containing protein [Modicisalibacter sp. MOD 31.J]MBZ9574539.1 toprim domain-containing protein [Modicisalibacter sp. MOD 31.J]